MNDVSKRCKTISGFIIQTCPLALGRYDRSMLVWGIDWTEEKVRKIQNAFGGLRKWRSGIPTKLLKIHLFIIDNVQLCYHMLSLQAFSKNPNIYLPNNIFGKKHTYLNDRREFLKPKSQCFGNFRKIMPRENGHTRCLRLLVSYFTC